MMKTRWMLLAVALAACALTASCDRVKPPAAEPILPPPDVRPPIVTHVHSLERLHAGDCRGHVSLYALQRGNDTGFGIFEHFDGDLVLIDGAAYRSKDGTLVPAATTDRLTAGTAGRFRTDTMYDIGVSTREVFENAMDWKRERQGSAYLYKIRGVFQSVTVRSLPPPVTPCVPIERAESSQTLLTETNVAGVIVGVWFPDSLDDLAVPGHHYAFIRSDEAWGGRVSDFVIRQARVEISENRELRLLLAEP